jgi:protein SCO1/2
MITYCNKMLNLTGRRVALTLIIFIVGFFSTAPLMAEEAKSVEQNAEAPAFTRSTVTYKVPDVKVIRQDGKKLSFLKELDDGRPVILSFVFVSCAAICPMLAHVMSKVQAKLEQDGKKAHLISISIDPENDTPAKLTEFAKKFGAGADWNFYTGTRETSLALQKAFNTFRGDKMNHTVTLLMRSEPGKPWVRLEGFLSADAVIQEYSALTQK